MFHILHGEKYSLTGTSITTTTKSYRCHRNLTSHDWMCKSSKFALSTRTAEFITSIYKYNVFWSVVDACLDDLISERLVDKFYQIWYLCSEKWKTVVCYVWAISENCLSVWHIRFVDFQLNIEQRFFRSSIFSLAIFDVTVKWRNSFYLNTIIIGSIEGCEEKYENRLFKRFGKCIFWQIVSWPKQKKNEQ